MTRANREYDVYPKHPLHRVPQAVLDAARSAADEAAVTRDIEPELAHSIADSIIMAALPEVYAWLNQRPEKED